MGLGGCQAGGETGVPPHEGSQHQTPHSSPGVSVRRARLVRPGTGRGSHPPRGIPVGTAWVPGSPSPLYRGPGSRHAAGGVGTAGGGSRQEGVPPDCPHRPLLGSPSPPWAPRAETWQLMALPAVGTGGGVGNGLRAAPPSVPGSPFPWGFDFGAAGEGVGRARGPSAAGMCGAGRGGKAVLELELRGHKGSYKTGMF